MFGWKKALGAVIEAVLTLGVVSQCDLHQRGEPYFLAIAWLAANFRAVKLLIPGRQLKSFDHGQF